MKKGSVLKVIGLPTYQEGLGMNFIIRCNGNANEVMRLARDVLLKVNYQLLIYILSLNGTMYESLEKNITNKIY